MTDAQKNGENRFVSRTGDCSSARSVGDRVRAIVHQPDFGIGTIVAIRKWFDVDVVQIRTDSGILIETTADAVTTKGVQKKTEKEARP